jgi:hypothetical protein
MGYTTEFEGAITINPPAGFTLTDKVNEFCNQRHDDGGWARRNDPGVMPSIHCDWEVAASGEEIAWNGSEKSYEMERWLPILIEKFFKGKHTLNGEMRAQGEDPDDRWAIVCTDNVVTVKRGRVVYE